MDNAPACCLMLSLTIWIIILLGAIVISKVLGNWVSDKIDKLT